MAGVPTCARRDIDNLPPGFMDSTYCLNQAHRMSKSQLMDAKRAYYACITQIDYELGRMMEMLPRYADVNLNNTIMIFTADHGDMLGDHHMHRKCYAYEGSARIPFVIHYPS